MRRSFILGGLASLVLAALMAHPVMAQDLNGDGFVDAVFTAKQDFNQVCYGDGTGAFTSCVDVKGAGQFLMSNTFNTTAAALGDWDGDLDIVFAINNDPNRVCLNDGGGDFNSGTGCVDLHAAVFDSEDVAVGDIDGDTFLDIVFANGGDAGAPTNRQNQVCFGGNGGCAFFTDGAPSTGVALGDVDNDGDLDVLVSNRGVENTGCLYEGRSFGFAFGDCRSITPAPGVPVTKVSNAVDVGNLPASFKGDVDDLLDVVFANSGKNETCLGTGVWEEEEPAGFSCLSPNAASSWTWNDSTATSLDVVVADTAPDEPNEAFTGDEMVFANVDAPNVFCFGRFFCSFNFQPTEEVLIDFPPFDPFVAIEPIGEQTTGVAVGDVGVRPGEDPPQGNLDVVVSNADSVSRTCWGLGKFGFDNNCVEITPGTVSAHKRYSG